VTGLHSEEEKEEEREKVSFLFLHDTSPGNRPPAKPLQLHLTIKKSTAKGDICGHLYTVVAKKLGILSLEYIGIYLKSFKSHE